MDQIQRLRTLSIPNTTKILFWIFDGVSGLPHRQTGLTELETAHTPYIDAFAHQASCGTHEPCGAGVTAGSGLGHLALFGYPTQNLDVPRGVLEVLGSSAAFHQDSWVPMPQIQATDLAIRCNFARLVGQGADAVIEDRRANTMDSQTCRALCQRLSQLWSIHDDVQIWVAPGKEHRFSLLIRGANLSDQLTDADPLRSGQPQPRVCALASDAQKSADLINDLIDTARLHLVDDPHADTVLMRGMGHMPTLDGLDVLYKMKCAALASYPMYKGIARLVGMDVLDGQQGDLASRLDRLEEAYDKYDFFFFHIKETDSLAHRGDFDGKVAFLEASDAHFKRALDMGFDVVVLTGDHCTPSIFGEHSWHPIPVALWSDYVFAGQTKTFTERDCLVGTLGCRPSTDLMPMALAEARRLNKHGA